MRFAPQHSSYHNNYSHGWPENQNMSYRSNNPEISPFASRNHMQGFRYEQESHNYAPQQFYFAPTNIPRHQEMYPMELNGPPFGEPTPPAHVEYQVQVPTQDDFDDIEKLTLLTLEFTWSAQDDPIRKVILEEMKKIRSGKELVEEVRKIEKNMNAGVEQDSIRQEEEKPQIEDVFEAKAQDDLELECQGDQVEEPSSLTPQEVKEAAVLEDEEVEVH
ncbi:hypothetical protein D1007_21314 [Hordeum vulgare]|nr:hypothetical protein D1007_21314 [Hordeum vulgare]